MSHKECPIGIIPAAGRGLRLGRLPFSKELYPIGYRPATAPREGWQPFVVIEDLIERMTVAEAKRIFIVLARGKSAIMDYLGDGGRYGVELCYLVQEEANGMPFALDLPFHWLREETVLFGMPDTLVRPKDIFVQLLSTHVRTGAELTLALFPTDRPEQFGMVGADSEGRVTETVDKPKATRLRHMWGSACWAPTFSVHMNQYLKERASLGSEVVLSSVFQDVLEQGRQVRSVTFSEGTYIDIGTVEGLRHGLQRFADD